MVVKGYGALILYTNRLEQMVEFYTELGLNLKIEKHEDGPKHYACEVGSLHFAIFEATEGKGDSLSRRKGGATQISFIIKNVAEVFQSLRTFGNKIIWEPREIPWGIAAMIEDPDGRAVEFYQNI